MKTTRWILALLVTAVFSLAGCNGPVEYLQFDYVVQPANSSGIMAMDASLRAGNTTFHTAVHGGTAAVTCEYMATFEVTQAQGNPLLGDNRTEAPDLDGNGNPDDSGFSFTIQAPQARTRMGLCDTIATTVQGIELVSLQGGTDGTWRSGAESRTYMRAGITTDELGPAVIYENDVNGNLLIVEVRLDSFRNNYLTGQFRFLAASPGADSMLIVANGKFGLVR